MRDARRTGEAGATRGVGRAAEAAQHQHEWP
jgi:hypothetical protein